MGDEKMGMRDGDEMMGMRRRGCENGDERW